jgi:L-seryl-tRNA(Ser) seleniumtransferase/D-glucosaminate-6-phosphate ammonia-lyase
MSTSPYSDLGLPQVINASGKMTALGGTAQADAVADAQRRAAQYHVDLAALRALAGERIAERAGAEAATVTTGAAAGIAIGVAAMITGADRDKIERLPDTDGLAAEIILQAGHDVSFGARVTQMIRLGGGRPILVGSRESVQPADVSKVISDRTAGLLFVQSHHTRQQNGLTLDQLVTLGRERGLPTLVDAAAEADLTTYIEQGADLVTYSGGKAIGGPTCGFITGRSALIDACELQNVGIARAMKVGKEQIIGLLTALDHYPAKPTWLERVDRLEAALQGLPDAVVGREADLAGRDIERVALRSTPERLRRLADALSSGDPVIYTRNHQLEEGLMLFDLREVRDADVDLLAEQVRRLWTAERT